MNTYEFTYKVCGYRTIRVEANSQEEAMVEGKKEIENTDFGWLEDIEWEETWFEEV